MGVSDRAMRADLGRAALALAAEKPWREITLTDLARRAGRSPADFYPAVKADAIEAVEEAFDIAMAEGAAPSEESVRDRLFDVLMKRFEAMEPHRAALEALDEALDRDPMSLGAAHLRNARTARWALALTGLDGDTVNTQARTQGLAVIIGQARAAWRADRDGDFAKTMASLDKNLRRAEETFGRFAGFNPRAKPSESGA